MGALTDDMARLREEIGVLRARRAALIQDLVYTTSEREHAVVAMRANSRKAHTEMARRARDERKAFVLHLGSTVAAMQTGFRRAHARMARDAGAARAAFVHEQKRAGAAARQALAADLAGARRAWRGPSAAERRAQEEAAETARRQAHAERERAEAEQRASQDAAALRRLQTAEGPPEAPDHAPGPARDANPSTPQPGAAGDIRPKPAGYAAKGKRKHGA